MGSGDGGLRGRATPGSRRESGPAALAQELARAYWDWVGDGTVYHQRLVEDRYEVVFSGVLMRPPGRWT